MDLVVRRRAAWFVLSVFALVAAAAGRPFVRAAVRCPEPPPDAPNSGEALVFLVRKGRMLGAAPTWLVFAEGRFLTSLDNGTYSAVRLTPGRHGLWWTTRGGPEDAEPIEVKEGEVHFIRLGFDGREVLDPVEGRRVVAREKDCVVPSENEIRRAATALGFHFPSGEWSAEPAIAVRGPPPPAPPGVPEVAGKIRIPSGTTIRLELLENVSSANSHEGEPVWFRVSEDWPPDGSVSVARDTLVRGIVRRAIPSGAGGRRGYLSIEVPFITAVGGEPVPVTGRAESIGGRFRKSEGSAPLTAAVVLSPAVLLGALVVAVASAPRHGAESFHFAGETAEVVTAGDSWVAPRREETGPEEIREPAIVRRIAAVPDGGEVRLRPFKGRFDRDLVFFLDSDSEPVEARFSRVGERELPAPVASKEIRRKGEVWAIRFEGWEIVRHVRATGPMTTVPVEIRGRLRDGGAFEARAEIALRVEPARDEK